MTPAPAVNKAVVLGCGIDALGWDETLATIRGWVEANESRYVCHCNVHALVTARRNPEFQRVLNDADMATPDGMPVAWLLRRIGFADQARINGPDLMWKLCAQAAALGHRVYLVGGTDQTLQRLSRRLTTAFPGLQIAGAEAPPFRSMTEAESRAAGERINRSGARIVFVGLGCPKQEFWMAAGRGRIRAVMLGVGAAFDYHAGTVKRAPRWMRERGLEWLHRLMSEPRRLFRRYLVTNVLFMVYVTRHFIRSSE